MTHQSSDREIFDNKLIQLGKETYSKNEWFTNELSDKDLKISGGRKLMKELSKSPFLITYVGFMKKDKFQKALIRTGLARDCIEAGLELEFLANSSIDCGSGISAYIEKQRNLKGQERYRVEFIKDDWDGCTYHNWIFN